MNVCEVGFCGFVEACVFLCKLGRLVCQFMSARSGLRMCVDVEKEAACVSFA